MAHPTQQVAPPSIDIIVLTILDLALYAALFAPAAYISWKHGKAGLVSWGLLMSQFLMRFLSDSYQIAHRGEPNIPNAVSIFTAAGTIACLTLALMGLLYEASLLLPSPHAMIDKIFLAIGHIVNVAGIAMATYGGSPSSASADGVASSILNKVGNCLMLMAMALLFGCAFALRGRKQNVGHEPSSRKFNHLVLTAIVGASIHLVRLVYSTVYAFHHASSLDPVMGAFWVKTVLIFVPQVLTTLAMLAGGWTSIYKSKSTKAQGEPHVMTSSASIPLV